MDRPSPRAERRRIEAFLSSERKQFESALGELVSLPSVSMNPAHRNDIRRTAQSARKWLEACGARSEIFQSPGFPVVIGEFERDAGRPTLTLYNHLDVQPADEPEWRQPPFRFEVRGNRYLGRGTTDDKGPALTALWAAKYAADNGLPLNIRFIWELEEEIGSPHFEPFLTRMGRRLRTDSVLVSDTIWLARGRPAVPYALRGLLAARLVLKTGSKDAHSGLTGGAARNPVSELCAVAAACHDPGTGRIKIPDFYRGILPLLRWETKRFESSAFSVSRFRRAHGLLRISTRGRREIMRRLWTEPTFEVHAISGGYQGPGVKTAVPARAEAKVSMRLVPGQDPGRIFSRLKGFVRRLNPDVEVFPEGMLRPYLGESSGPYAQAVRESFRFGFGRDPDFIREGGSIGAVVAMKDRLKAPIVFLGLSLPEHGYHAPNEYFDWGQVRGGALSFVKYFGKVAALGSTGGSARAKRGKGSR